MKVLITGGAGYTGVPLVQALLGRNIHVTVLDTFESGATALFGSSTSANFSAVRMDFRDITREVLQPYDFIFHLAAISGYPECAARPNAAWDINVVATERLLSHLRSDQRLIFASTTSFYGSSGKPSSEETPIEPASLYGETKAKAEELVMSRPESVSLRWATVFGLSPRLRLSLMVNDFTLRALEDRSITLYDPDSRRSFIHVDDLVSGYLFIADNWQISRNQVFNMGSELLNLTKMEVARIVQSHIECDIFVSQAKDKDIRHFYVEFGKIQRLGWSCTRSIDDGVVDMAKAFSMVIPRNSVL